MRVAVLFGGASEERDVSIASASQIVPALRRQGHDVNVVDTAFGVIGRADEAAHLSPAVGNAPPTGLDLTVARQSDDALRLPAEVANVDLVFLALHGGTGEDGRLQALLELAGIPYTGSGPLGSGLALDKDISKSLLRDAGIRTPDWFMASGSVPRPRTDVGTYETGEATANAGAETGGERPPGTAPAEAAPAEASASDAEAADTTVHEIQTRLGFPVIVKPASQGSTVGLSVVRNPGDIADAVATASAFGPVMIEAFIRGRELTVGVLDDEPLAVGEIIIHPDEAFTYQDKYQAGAVREVFPADIPSEIEDAARSIALHVHRTLRLDSYSRTDFRLDEHGTLWVIEANSLPGMTATSLLPQSAAAAGIDYDELCERICACARLRIG
ncbi:ATP-grasp domain-containing protein [Microbacterium sp. MPKO10]|uniref:D-alanine--D-alanine ligase family protein n=1 Tax=Microbacterium sp. MPKO10 TaxID=2989818 RepID=UPI002236262E|nr:ATP-grasp domain-containing protein [Microbacterium sp. MPKO10]MCW4458763.1 ATP-grasp domain-containing protein [Microbacterium sp. MPKO10]